MIRIVTRQDVTIFQLLPSHDGKCFPSKLHMEYASWNFFFDEWRSCGLMMITIGPCYLVVLLSWKMGSRKASVDGWFRLNIFKPNDAIMVPYPLIHLVVDSPQNAKLICCSVRILHRLCLRIRTARAYCTVFGSWITFGSSECACGPRANFEPLCFAAGLEEVLFMLWTWPGERGILLGL